MRLRTPGSGPREWTFCVALELLLPGSHQRERGITATENQRWFTGTENQRWFTGTENQRWFTVPGFQGPP
jgi:hypothetical protein